MKLVIVESPTKARTIARFLDKSFRVESSFGHVRDLPKSTMGVDIEHNFEPKYVVPVTARKRVSDLKKLAARASEIYLATDEDREGEAIAWHLLEILDPKKQSVHRITFHEITKEAITNALTHPRDVDPHLVDAQQGRRVLDRLVGYELSPFLWKKIYRGLSAGRVQSVVVRLIVEREREIQKFLPREYWTIDATLQTSHASNPFTASLTMIDNKKIDKFHVHTKDEADTLLKELHNAEWRVAHIEQKARTRKSLAPFTTSTLQQEANNACGYSTKQTMRLAQQLYEGIDCGEGSEGLITYMRTDSTNLAESFLTDAHAFITKTFGASYADRKTYRTKAKGAQEAHEAIRPTNVERTPETIKQFLSPQQYKIYDLIWRRAVASQMNTANINATTVDIAAKQNIFRATGSQLIFDGWLKLFPDRLTEKILPQLTIDEIVTCKSLQGNQHFTEPPARYTEAAMVKALEEMGIGRPSTYAPTIATVQDRGYVRKEQKQLIPEEIGFLVNDLLVEHFPEIVDYHFTATMEQQLDAIAEGEAHWQPIIQKFYEPFKHQLAKKDMELKKKDIVETPTDKICPKCGKSMVIKIGRFGKFLACSGYPECKTTQQITATGEIEKPEVIDKKCPTCQNALVKKHGRFGPFFGCSGYPECKYIENIATSTGIACPKCQKGEIIERKSKRGKMFYACNQYPSCENAYWSRPTGQKCSKCESLMVLGPRNTIKCSSKECSYTEETSAEK